MLRSTITRTLRVTPSLQQRRKMAGGSFPHDLGVKKNKFVEEWNGRREITEQSFNASGKTTPWIILLAVLAPYGVYSLTREELKMTGGRRYKDIL